MIFRGDATGSGNAMTVSDSSGTARVTVANQGRVTLGVDDSVTTETCAVIQAGTTNANLVIAPNGTGAIIADIPDGATAGGNARGDNAVDLQMVRGNNSQVASAVNSVIGGGTSNTASGDTSVVCGGNTNQATAPFSTILGGRVNITSGNGYSTIVGGRENASSGDYATNLGGYRGNAYLYAQIAKASGYFAAISDAQTSSITLRRSITGTGITELFLDGGTQSLRAILSLAAGPTNARAWRAQIDVVAICDTVGNGTGGLTQNDCFMGSYLVGIKRVGNSAALVGTVNTLNEVSDTSMSTSVTTITADNTNYALKIEFTPPSGTAGSTSVFRVVATAYLTEVGR